MKTIFPSMVIFCFLFAYSAAYGESLKEINQAISKEEKVLMKLQNEKRSAVKQIESLSTQISNFKRLITVLNREIDGNKRRIQAIRSQTAEINKSINKSKTDITKSNVFFIESMGFSQLAVVASVDNPALTVKTLEILSKAGSNLEINVQQQSLKVVELNELTTEERQRQREAENLNSQHKKAVARLEKDTKNYKNMLTVIKNDEVGRQEYVEMLKFRQKTLEDELKKASSLVIRKPESFSQAVAGKKVTHANIPKGTMVWPVAGKVTDTFGETYIEDAGITFFHKGIKIRPEKPSSVFAAAAGEVIFADYIKGFDYISVVDHGEAFYTVYGNMTELKSQAGEKVERGQILGRIHVDLNNDTSYLYFEIRKNEEALNPADWLAGYNKR